MSNIVGVKHIPQSDDKVWYFNNKHAKARVGDKVFVDTSRGLALAEVHEIHRHYYAGFRITKHVHCIVEKKEE